MTKDNERLHSTLTTDEIKIHPSHLPPPLSHVSLTKKKFASKAKLIKEYKNSEVLLDYPKFSSYRSDIERNKQDAEGAEILTKTLEEIIKNKNFQTLHFTTHSCPIQTIVKSLELITPNSKLQEVELITPVLNNSLVEAITFFCQNNRYITTFSVQTSSLANTTQFSIEKKLGVLDKEHYITHFNMTERKKVFKINKIVMLEEMTTILHNKNHAPEQDTTYPSSNISSFDHNNEQLTHKRDIAVLNDNLLTYQTNSSSNNIKGLQNTQNVTNISNIGLSNATIVPSSLDRVEYPLSKKYRSADELVNKRPNSCLSNTAPNTSNLQYKSSPEALPTVLPNLSNTIHQNNHPYDNSQNISQQSLASNLHGSLHSQQNMPQNLNEEIFDYINPNHESDLTGYDFTLLANTNSDTWWI